MSSLAQRLDRIREGFAKQAPPEAVETVKRVNERLRAEGILERLPRPGERLPAFELTDTEGRSLSSATLLARGPLVLTIWRGLW